MSRFCGGTIPTMPATAPEADFLVIGAGVAGLRAAIELAPAGRVLVLVKRDVAASSTQFAQGGIAAALSDEDEISLHLQDTLTAGDGLCNPEAARVLVEDAPQRIEELIAWGTQFDREGTKLTFGREGAHSRNRILHAHGDSTGREIQRALYAKAKTLPEISVREFEFSTDLISEGGTVCGVRVIDERGQENTIHASAVLLATGGMGQLYLNTTNPSVATGDGVAMAYRAGAEVTDLEFIQFHPTALYLKKAPRFLLSEALRGEGAYLRNMEMSRFMAKYHAMAELAPRDVVARAIMHELERVRAKDPVVYLDVTHLDEAHVRRRFPANRLASNSLLEGLVFGARAGKKMRNELKAPAARVGGLPPAAYSNGPLSVPVDASINELQTLMWNLVGIVRNAHGLKEAVERLKHIEAQVARPHSRREFEARNLQIAGLLVAQSALAREESRGAHYRTDFPDHNDVKFRKHSVVQAEIRFE